MKRFFLLSVLAYVGLCFAGDPGSSSSSLEKRNTLAERSEDELSSAKNPLEELNKDQLKELSHIVNELKEMNQALAFQCGRDHDETLEKYRRGLDKISEKFGIDTSASGRLSLNSLEYNMLIQGLKDRGNADSVQTDLLLRKFEEKPK